VTDYTATITVPHDITDTFTFIKDPTHLPDYFPRVREAELVEPELVRTTAVVDADQDGSDERVVSDAWFHVDEAAHRISWGAPGESDYHGSLALEEAGGETELTLSITTVHEIPEVQQGLDDALKAIADRLQGFSANTN
jgi:hypothetical protein